MDWHSLPASVGLRIDPVKQFSGCCFLRRDLKHHVISSDMIADCTITWKCEHSIYVIMNENRVIFDSCPRRYSDSAPSSAILHGRHATSSFRPLFRKIHRHCFFHWVAQSPDIPTCCLSWRDDSQVMDTDIMFFQLRRSLSIVWTKDDRHPRRLLFSAFLKKSSV